MISIIIPVYNAEKTISRTIESILCQTYKEFEVILINDGSTDSSSHICHKWSKSDERIFVFDKENGGVGSARNYGIRKAKGQYITFIDADDYLDQEALKTFSEFCKDDVDLVFAEYAIVDENEGEVETIEYKNELPVRLDNVQCDIITKLLHVDGKETMMGSSCRTLIKRSLIIKNKVWFDECLRMSEDLKFILELVCFAKNTRVINKVLYYYVRVKGRSATQKYMESMYRDMNDVDNWKDKYIAPMDNRYKNLINIGRANSFIVGIININRPFTPYTISERVKWCRVNYEKNKYFIKQAIKNRRLMRKTHWFACLFCDLHLFKLIVLLYAWNNKTLFHNRKKVEYK